MYVTAINAIHRSAKASPSFVNPGEVVELHGAERDRVLEAGVGREATEDEVILARHKGQLSKAKDTNDDTKADEDAAAKKAEADAKKKADADAKKQAQADAAAKKQAAEDAKKQADEDAKKQSGGGLDLD